MRIDQNITTTKREMTTKQFILSMTVYVVAFACVILFAHKSFGYFNSYNTAQNYTKIAIEERQEENLNSLEGMTLLP